jgi:hypothetical protein
VVGEISDDERASWWSNGGRAERYRKQAGRLQLLAEMEQHPGTRKQLLDLAGQYLRLAARFAGHTLPG